MHKRVTGSLAVLTAIVATTLIGVSPAQAAGCATGNAQPWSVYNSTCTWARHVSLQGKNPHYGSKVGPRDTSYQVRCHSGQTAYFAEKSSIATAAA